MRTLSQDRLSAHLEKHPDASARLGVMAALQRLGGVAFEQQVSERISQW